MQVSSSQILLICKAKLKVDSEQILHPQASSSIEEAAQLLNSAGSAADQDCLHPESDLKIHDIDLVLKLRERQRLLEVNFHHPK